MAHILSHGAGERARGPRWLYGEASAQEAVEGIADTYTSARDSDVPDAVMDQPVSAFDSDQYTAIVSGKGALFFNVLYKLLGPAAFGKSLSEYYRKDVFRNATTEDLLSSFRAKASDPARVDQLYQRWIKELHGDEDVPRS
ncbi:MAG TPA: M1 family aminopeptidase [Candidatus Anoxymicrobiaceae bacterium]